MSRFSPRASAPTSSPSASATGPRPAPRRAPASQAAPGTYVPRYFAVPPRGAHALEGTVHVRAAPGAAQAKLAVGAVDSPAEREADDVARRFAGRSRRAAAGRCGSCGGACCGTGPMVHRDATPGATVVAPVAPAAVVPTRDGHTLPTAARTQAEAFFGHGFGHVRVHTDGDAARRARELDARAYTVGSHIVFGAGQYAPHAPAGMRLLVHELTHVVQQGGRGPVVQRDPLDGGAAAQTPDAASDPRPAASEEDSVTFMGEVLSPDPAVLRRVLEARVARSPEGLEAAADLVARLRDHLSLQDRLAERQREYALADPHNRSDFSGVPEDPDAQPEVRRLRDVLPPLEQQRQALHGEAARFLGAAERAAREAMLVLLAESERRLDAERRRYGLTERQVEAARSSRDVRHGEAYEWTERRTVYGMAQGESASGLSRAARLLARSRRELDEAAQRHRALMMAGPNAPPSLLGAGLEELSRKREAYESTRGALAAQYPILASFDGEDDERLEAVTRAATPEAAAVLSQQIHDRQENIRAVREHLARGAVQVWKVDRVVDAALRRMNVAAGSMQARLVEVHRARLARDETVEGLMLGAFSLAMALLAPATGGATAVVGAGVSLRVADAHLQEYVLEHAMAGTDFDRARSLSAEEPSLFWLALDIVGALVDVGQAANAAASIAQSLGRAAGLFGRLVPWVRRAQSATSALEAEAAARQLAQVAERELGPATAERIASEARRGAPELATLSQTSGRLSPQLQAALHQLQRPITLNGEAHLLFYRVIDGRVVPFLCSGNCGMLVAKAEAVLQRVPHENTAARQALEGFISDTRSRDWIDSYWDPRTERWIEETPEDLIDTLDEQLNTVKGRLESLTADLRENHGITFDADIDPSNARAAAAVEQPQPATVAAGRPQSATAAVADPNDRAIFDRNGLSIRDLKPDVTLAAQMRGEGQLATLQRSPNLSGIGAEEAVARTPRQLAQLVVDGRITKKVFNSIMKIAEGRNLGAGGRA